MSLLTTFRQLGPGLLYAGAAVGVSHLVQSTQAGAAWGLSLVWVVVLANVLKYPFFEFGPRYAAATGESLVEGYRKLWGGTPLLLFVLLTLGTMFIIQAAVTIVTGGLAAYLVEYAGWDVVNVGGNDWGEWIWGTTTGPDGQRQVSAVGLSGRILALCALVLAVGRYKILDKVMKVVILLLTLTTLLALGMALAKGGIGAGNGFGAAEWLDPTLVAAWIIPLVGWMPAPLDIAVWHSVWSLEGKEGRPQEGKAWRAGRLDFRIGYWGTTLLAICFLSLGAFVIFGSGVTIESKAVPFARQLIDMYAQTLGEWARPIIALAAFTTMLSTTLTCLDAFPRVLSRATRLFVPEPAAVARRNGYYWGWITLTALGTFFLLLWFLSDMRQMITLATAISFLTAPLLATFSFLAVRSSLVPPERRPRGAYLWFAVVGLVFLYIFAAYYIHTLV